MGKKGRVSIPFLATVIFLTAFGFLIFTSASLGLLAREEGATFSSVAVSQILFGLILGGLAAFILSRLDYRIFKAWAPYVFGAAVLLTILTFIPGIGLELKGAHRWIHLGSFTFQPAEALKGAAVLLLAALFATNYRRVGTLRGGLAPFLAILGVCGVLLLLQPDTDTFLVLALALTGMFFAAGGRLLHLTLLALVGIIAAGGLILARPYLLDRVMTFVDPSRDPLGSGYQIQQSHIAIGSGEIFGRGFGQSVQKFSYLPEPIGDSIFAVAAEEFGFVGSTLLVAAFLAFVASGLRIAARAPDAFGGLLVCGLVILIGGQSFINIASLLGLFPFGGMPLIFISHGGTALLVALAEVGVILSVSRRMHH